VGSVVIVPRYGILAQRFTASVSYHHFNNLPACCIHPDDSAESRDFLLTRSEIILLINEVRNIYLESDLPVSVDDQ